MIYFDVGAEGACKNSQAKGPVSDDTLESKNVSGFCTNEAIFFMDTESASDEKRHTEENLSGKIQRQQAIVGMLSLS